MNKLPLENFENSRARVFVCQNTLVCLLLSKHWSLVRRRLDYGKKWEFLNLWSISLEISLFMFQQVWKLSLICKNKPSGGKEWSIYVKFESKQICVFICIDVALPLVAFHCVGINHQKGGRLKGKCAPGPFLSILVIVPTQVDSC